MLLWAITLIAVLTGFTGRWERDPERSDDPQEKMEAAMEQRRGEMRGRRRPPGGMPPGGMPRGGSKGGPGGGRSPMALGRVADTLEIEHEAGELRVYDAERARIYYLDGEEHKRQLENGVTLETTAKLAGNAVSIEEKMDRGKILHEYELSPDEQTLVVTRTLELGGDPVILKTVYTRAGTAE